MKTTILGKEEMPWPLAKRTARDLGHLVGEHEGGKAGHSPRGLATPLASTAPCSLIPISYCQSSPDQVRDIDGNFLQSGTDYHLLPVFRRMGGGVTLAPTRNGLCHLDVVQAILDVDNGLPLTFTPVGPNEGVIRESTDLNIIFSAATVCIQSNVWMLEEYDGSLIVAAHGVEGNPGQETISNWFRIEKYDSDYKLVFCPTVCDVCRPICGDIGVEIAENGSRRLVMSDVPFKIMFEKA